MTTTTSENAALLFGHSGGILPARDLPESYVLAIRMIRNRSSLVLYKIKIRVLHSIIEET